MAKRPSDPFDSPKLLLRGARKDVDRFDREWRHFHERCFGLPFEQVDPQTSQRVFKYRIIPDLPDELRVLASNAFNNIRHVLDQAVNCAAIELGSTQRNNYFPFAQSASDIDRIIKDNCKTVRPDLIPTLKAFKPYGGGDDVLYTLAKLSGPNKHRIVFNVDPNMNSILLNGEWFRYLKVEAGSPVCNLGFLGWDGEKQEVEVLRIGPRDQAQLHPMTNVPVFVSLSDSEISRGEPATAFLNTLASKVDGILRAIEAETARLKT